MSHTRMYNQHLFHFQIHAFGVQKQLQVILDVNTQLSNTKGKLPHNSYQKANKASVFPPVKNMN